MDSFSCVRLMLFCLTIVKSYRNVIFSQILLSEHCDSLQLADTVTLPLNDLLLAFAFLSVSRMISVDMALHELLLRHPIYI